MGRRDALAISGEKDNKREAEQEEKRKREGERERESVGSSCQLKDVQLSGHG